MEWLAEFMEWHIVKKLDHIVFEEKPVLADDYGMEKYPDSWDCWMTEVEPRIRERGLWSEYVFAVFTVCGSTGVDATMEATLEQRAEALKRVLA